MHVRKRSGSTELTNYEMANLRGRAGRLMKAFIGRTFVLDESEVIETDGYDQSIKQAMMLKALSGPKESGRRLCAIKNLHTRKSILRQYGGLRNLWDISPEYLRRPRIRISSVIRTAFPSVTGIFLHDFLLIALFVC